jgi:hypothetical protein
MSTHSYDQFVEACAAFPRPNPFPSDWCLTHVGGEHAYRLPPSIIRARSLADKDEWAMSITCPVTAEVSVTIYAKTEKQARELVLKQMNGCDAHRINSGDANGWNAYSYGYDVELLSIYQDKSGKALRHSFEIPVDTLVSADRSWHPYEIDQIIETFRWLAVSGTDYHQQCTWHDQKVSHLLNGGYGNNPFSSHELKPILSMKDLKRRLQYALLANGYDFYAKWREDVGYQLGKTLKIETAHRGKGYNDIALGPPHTINEALEKMLVQSRGMKLAWSLNSCHAAAVEIDTIGLSVGASGFSFILRYGYEGSSWSYVIASTRGSEPFAETLNRAYVLFLRLVPDFKDQLQAMNEAKWRVERESRRGRPVEPEYA